MDLALKDLGEYITGQLPDDVTGATVSLDELMVSAKVEGIARVLAFLRDDVNCRKRRRKRPFNNTKERLGHYEDRRLRP